MQSTDTSAYGVLRDYFATICESEIDPIRLGTSLFAAKVINAGTRDDAAAQGRSDMHIRTLVDAVMRQGRPGAFQTFVETVGRDPKCNFHNKLKDAYITAGGQWLGSSPPTQSHALGAMSRDQQATCSGVSSQRQSGQHTSSTQTSCPVEASDVEGPTEMCIAASHPGDMSRKRLHDGSLATLKVRDEDEDLLNLKGDLFRVRCALLPISSKWGELALCLGLDYSWIEEMKAKHGRAVDKCVTEVAVKWLRGGGKKRPSWEQLVKVISTEMGGNNPAYAEKVASYAFLEDCPKCCCDTAATILDVRSHGDVVMELWSIAERWKEIGIFLGIDYNSLESFEHREPKDALSAVVNLWLSRRYDCVAFGEPTWKKLVEAVHSKAGAADDILASKIATSRKKKSL